MESKGIGKIGVNDDYKELSSNGFGCTQSKKDEKTSFYKSILVTEKYQAPDTGYPLFAPRTWSLLTKIAGASPSWVVVVTACKQTSNAGGGGLRDYVQGMRSCRQTSFCC